MAVEQMPRQARQGAGADELKGFLEQVWRRVQGVVDRTAAAPADELGSAEWLAQVGRSWRSARQQAGMDIDALASRLGITSDQVRFQELGLVRMQDLADPAAANLEVGWRPKRVRARWSAGWLLRQLLTIGLAHAAVLMVVYFLLLMGDALFTSYAIVLRDSVFVSYVAQLGWLQRMASDIKSTIAFVVGLSALVQSLVLLWRVGLNLV